MSDSLESFIDFMHSVGCGPAKASDIRPDDKVHSYQLQGDRNGKKAGGYRFKSDGNGVGLGWCINHREGVSHNFYSKAPKYYTPEETKAFREKMEAEKKAAEAQREQEMMQVAQQAKAHWDTLTIAGPDHPYLVRKKISPHGLRISDNNLIVPMYFDGKICNYQTITPDGDKLFLKNARMKGTFFPLASRDDDKARIVICEGVATGASIRQALGWPVIVAFNASNLIPVAEEFRRKYPNAQIIIAADNDQWSWDGQAKAKNCPKDLVTSDIPGDDDRWKNWRKAGWLRNVGRDKADQAAVSIGGAHVIWPEFPASHPDKPTDFNDLHCIDGLDAVKERILKLPEPELEPEQKSIVLNDHINSTNFWDYLRVRAIDKSGQKIKYEDNSLNYSMIVQYHPRLQGLFAWDEFHLSVMVVACPPWTEDQGRAKQFEVHELDDIDVRECDYFIQRCIGELRGSREKTREAIEDIAHKNKIHPARDYFDSLTWDGQPRLDNWLIDYVGCEKDDPDYVRAVGRTWMLAAVARVYEPGCKFDHMLILEGPQSAGKSTTLQTLATFGQGKDARDYFCDTMNIRNCEDPDELMKTRGAMIVEIQEMAGFTKKDDDTLKAFITQKTDQYRSPYGRKTQKWPRQYVLAGTYNPIAGVFKDPTGLRRFWVVSTGKHIDVAGLRLAREQIWAEATHRYKAGESLYLSPELSAKAEAAANQRRIVDDMTHDVLEKVRGVAFFEVRQVLEWLGIPVRGRSQIESANICRILKIEGFQRTQRRVGGRTIWGWEPPDSTRPPMTVDLWEGEER